MKSLNEQLLEVQSVWEEECYIPLKEEYKQNEEKLGKLSCAFGFGVSDDYLNAPKRVMIVGQEANDHSLKYVKWNLKNWQKWAVAYLEYQLDINKENEYDIQSNYSPFWQFIKRFKEAGYGVCWNNLDKVRRYEYLLETGWKEKKLQYDKENSKRALLNKRIFDGNGKSLLQKEIEIAKPDTVVFAVGPRNPYYHTLCLALLGENSYDKLLKSYPDKSNYCVDITDKLNLGIPAYYTYHPNFLNRNKKLEGAVATILRGKN